MYRLFSGVTPGSANKLESNGFPLVGGAREWVLWSMRFFMLLVSFMSRVDWIEMTM